MGHTLTDLSEAIGNVKIDVETLERKKLYSMKNATFLLTAAILDLLEVVLVRFKQCGTMQIAGPTLMNQG
jgi:hypothetical protein